VGKECRFQEVIYGRTSVIRKEVGEGCPIARDSKGHDQHKGSRVTGGGAREVDERRTNSTSTCRKERGKPAVPLSVHRKHRKRTNGGSAGVKRTQLERTALIVNLLG